MRNTFPADHTEMVTKIFADADMGDFLNHNVQRVEHRVTQRASTFARENLLSETLIFNSP